MGRCRALASNAKGGEIPYSLKVRSGAAHVVRLSVHVDDCINCEETLSGAVTELDTSPLRRGVATRHLPSYDTGKQKQNRLGNISLPQRKKYLPMSHVPNYDTNKQKKNRLRNGKAKLNRISMLLSLHTRTIQIIIIHNSPSSKSALISPIYLSTKLPQQSCPAEACFFKHNAAISMIQE